MVIMAAIGVLVSVLVAQHLSSRRGGGGWGTLTVLVAVIAAEIVMIGYGDILMRSYPEHFLRTIVKLRAMGNILIVVPGALIGVWLGRRQRLARKQNSQARAVTASEASAEARQ